MPSFRRRAGGDGGRPDRGQGGSPAGRPGGPAGDAIGADGAGWGGPAGDAIGAVGPGGPPDRAIGAGGGSRNRPAAPGRPSDPAETAPSLPEIVDLPAPRPAAWTRPRVTFEGPVIVCENLVRIYKVADLEVVALQGLDLVVERGEMIAIVGASGSGKSTLLNILGGLDSPSAGRAVVAGHDLARMGRAERTRYRRRVVGFVWQQTWRNLLPYLTAVENVALPLVLDGRGDRDRRALELLDLVGLAGRARERPERLSGGEQQRVAIAVALANGPEVLLADEPTGELDSRTAAEIFHLLRRVNRELGTTIVSVTHDPLVAGHVERVVAIRDGRTSTETVHRRERTEEGAHRLVAEEYAVLDRAGRLQLPRAHIEALGLERRVRLRLEPDHVRVSPDRPVPGVAGASAAHPAADVDAPAPPGAAASGDPAADEGLRRDGGEETAR